MENILPEIVDLDQAGCGSLKTNFNRDFSEKNVYFSAFSSQSIPDNLLDAPVGLRL